MKNRRSSILYTDAALLLLPILLLLVVGAFVSMSEPVSGKDPVTGAVWTTDPNGERVNGNLYANARDVYIAGGPHKIGAAGLPDGVYYFQVTDPPGKTLLSTDDVEDRIFEVKYGEIYAIPPGGTHQSNQDTTRGFGIVVQLWPFGQTPNKGGVYKVWVTEVGHYQGPDSGDSFGFVHSLSKTDNFKVKVQGVPKYFELFVAEGISELYNVAFYVNYTTDVDGNPNTIDPLLPWTTEQLTEWDETRRCFRDETTFPMGVYIYWQFFIKNTFEWCSDVYGPELIPIQKKGHVVPMVNQETPPIPPKTFSLTIKPPIPGASYFANYTYYDELGNPIGNSHIVPLTTRTGDTFSGTVEIAGIIKWQFFIKNSGNTEIWRSQTQGPETIPPGTTPRTNPFYLSSILGYKFEDHNGDGVPNGGDHGLQGWTIQLYKDSCPPTGTLIAETTTNETGHYRFEFLVSGTYYVCEKLESGWVQTTSPKCHQVIIHEGEAVKIPSADFGNFKEFCIKGHKYNDTDGDGSSGTNTPIEGWKIMLYNNSQYVTQTWTGSDGSYSFCGLGPGSYTVVEEVKAGWINTTSTSLGPFPGVSGQNITGVDFYNFKLFKVNGHKYSHPCNIGLRGWNITLYKDSTLIAWTLTDSHGYYEFTGLGPGTYTVSETPMPGWVPFGPTNYTFTALSGVDRTFDFYNYEMMKITDTSNNRCPLSDFDIVFTPSNEGFGKYKFSSTNPGSFYFNVVNYGSAGSPVTIVANMSLDQQNAPYDSPNFILHHTNIGSTPTVDVHVYANRTASPCGGYWVPDWSKDITNLFNIDVTADGKSVTVSGYVPNTGTVFVTIHIDYQISGSLTFLQALSFEGFGYTFRVGSATLQFPVDEVKIPLRE